MKKRTTLPLLLQMFFFTSSLICMSPKIEVTVTAKNINDCIEYQKLTQSSSLLFGEEGVQDADDETQSLLVEVDSQELSSDFQNFPSETLEVLLQANKTMCEKIKSMQEDIMATKARLEKVEKLLIKKHQ